MDIVIGPESSIDTPAAGFATLFVNTDKNNILYLKYPDESFVPYNGSSSDCTCSLAKAWANRVTCALEDGTITANQFGTIMNQGFTVTTNTTTDDDGNVTNTVTMGSRQTTLIDFTLDSYAFTLLDIDPTHQIVPTFDPPTVSNQGVIYVSSDPSKATVSSTGLVTRVSDGTCNVSAIPQADPTKMKVIDVTTATD